MIICSDDPTPTFTRADLPRKYDGIPDAYLGDPDAGRVEVWQRCSPAYEEQAIELLDALGERGLGGFLMLAGTQDGEVLFASRATGPSVYLFQLEDPVEAERIATARAAGELDVLLDEALA